MSSDLKKKKKRNDRAKNFNFLQDSESDVWFYVLFL